jgi:TPR repeat protein
MRTEILCLTLLMAIAGTTPANDIWQSLFREKLREASRGDSDAQYDVGSMYQNGRGVTPDRAKAIEWYSKAAAQDNQKAVSRLELMRANETRFSRTEAHAARGDVDSQYDLGNMHEKGIGTRVNYQKARDWYEKAAAAGHAGASFNLGLMYHEGSGIGQDNKTAYAWFRDAADKGSTPAQYYLGKLYASGSGVRQDYAAALEWYSKAADGGFDQARGGIIEVREKMKQAQSVPATAKAGPATEDVPAGKPDAEEAPKPAAESEEKLIAQPEFEEQPAKAVSSEHNAALMETMMLDLWSRQGDPVSYLPSTINNCRTEEKRILCFSDDQTRESGENEVKFKTKAIISDFAADGSFQVRYRNLVITANQPDNGSPQEPEASRSDGETGVSSHTVNTGWGMEHTVECTMKNRHSLSCVKDKSRRIEIRSQQKLAHGS